MIELAYLREGAVAIMSRACAVVLLSCVLSLAGCAGGSPDSQGCADFEASAPSGIVHRGGDLCVWGRGSGTIADVAREMAQGRARRELSTEITARARALSDMYVLELSSALGDSSKQELERLLHDVVEGVPFPGSYPAQTEFWEEGNQQTFGACVLVCISVADADRSAFESLDDRFLELLGVIAPETGDFSLEGLRAAARRKPASVGAGIDR